MPVDQTLSSDFSDRKLDPDSLHLALILSLIRNGEATSRQEIERQTGLGRAIVADRLTSLINFGLIGEGKLAPSTGGRAPRSFVFREDAGRILLAVINDKAIGVGYADLSGRLRTEHYEAASMDDGPSAILTRLFALLDWFIEQHCQNQKIWGLGVAISAPVETHGTSLFELPRIHGVPGWEGFPLAEQFTARYGVPVWMRSAVQMMTLGEQRTGGGGHSNSMIFVDLGRDISAGFISDGRLHSGAQGGAGMIGHFAVETSDKKVCRCGNSGCLVTVAGSDAIVRGAMASAESGHSPLLVETLAATGEITPADIGVAAQRGDAFSAELMAQCGKQVGAVLANLTNAFNPSLIVLGGDIAKASDILLSSIREAVYRQAHPLVTRDLRIIRSQIGESSALAGASVVVTDNLFAVAPLSFWVARGSPLGHPQFAEHLTATRRASADRQLKTRPPNTADGFTARAMPQR
ncbi:putative NBD/HSP70 family sugar kinase [Rhizobium aethiopicum]|uniref:ROK family protein n=1 Tax=Rhizobium aethiopicum TaxID=1138170 RepID=UPI0016214EA2|nr:ROK family protein [Rhizobium aethiopicum]MBB4583534.1 putative NBD/HSP70 family sugar kinase [Rhizobium aethiopicum]